MSREIDRCLAALYLVASVQAADLVEPMTHGERAHVVPLVTDELLNACAELSPASRLEVLDNAAEHYLGDMEIEALRAVLCGEWRGAPGSEESWSQ
jgi:hypothetical protein